MKLNLTSKPEIIELKSTPLLYLEKRGPFMETAPKAWEQFWEICRPMIKELPIRNMVGLSRIDDSIKDDSKYIYQAGVLLNKDIHHYPRPVSVRNFSGGKYARFLLTGSYDQFQYAYPKAFEIIEQSKLKLRDEFCLEVYLNTPEDTPEAEIKTELLFPIQS